MSLETESADSGRKRKRALSGEEVQPKKIKRWLPVLQESAAAQEESSESAAGAHRKEFASSSASPDSRSSAAPQQGRADETRAAKKAGLNVGAASKYCICQ